MSIPEPITVAKAMVGTNWPAGLSIFVGRGVPYIKSKVLLQELGADVGPAERQVDTLEQI